MLIKLGVGLLATVSALTMALGIAIFQAGFATVEVDSPDTPSLYIPVPLAAVDVALAFVPKEELADARKELEPYRPLIEAVLSELRNCPDVTLVEVMDRDEMVLVVKAGDELRINVDERGHERVRVRVPISSIQHTFAALMN
jgi:hypothetical protein